MHLFPNYQRYNTSFVKGEGTYLWDVDGKAYLDFGSGVGVVNLGHCHPEIVRSLQEQVNQLWHTSNLFEIPIQEKLATDLCRISGMNSVFFCNSGAEANEAAFKLARKWGHEEKKVEQPEIITFKHSFHGRTLATLTATGQEKVKAGFGPYPPGFVIVPAQEKYEVKRATTPNTVAICLELVQGEGGVIPAEKDFVLFLAEWCRLNQILLIVDEIQTGMGRTGEYFSFQHYGIQPNIITLAKGLGNGFPVGAMLSQSLITPIFSPGTHGSTFGGNLLAVSVAQAVVELLTPTLLRNVKEKSGKMLDLLQKEILPLQLVKEIRALGLMMGIQLRHSSKQIIDEAREQGLIVLPAGKEVLRLLPPLIVSEEQIEEAVMILKQVITSNG